MDPLPIEGALSLRELTIDDAEELHELIAANRDQLSRRMSWAAKQTSEDTVAFLDRARQQSEQSEGAQLAVVESAAIIGVVGADRFDVDNRSVSIGYWIDERRQGRGIATKAVRAVCDHAFSTWDLNRIEIRAAIGNVPSRKLAERLGFEQEGILREAEVVNEEPLDCALYSMLAADWGASSTGRD